MRKFTLTLLALLPAFFSFYAFNAHACNFKKGSRKNADTYPAMYACMTDLYDDYFFETNDSVLFGKSVPPGYVSPCDFKTNGKRYPICEDNYKSSKSPSEAYEAPFFYKIKSVEEGDAKFAMIKIFKKDGVVSFKIPALPKTETYVTQDYLLPVHMKRGVTIQLQITCHQSASKPFECELNNGDSKKTKTILGQMERLSQGDSDLEDMRNWLGALVEKTYKHFEEDTPGSGLDCKKHFNSLSKCYQAINDRESCETLKEEIVKFRDCLTPPAKESSKKTAAGKASKKTQKKRR